MCKVIFSKMVRNLWLLVACGFTAAGCEEGMGDDEYGYALEEEVKQLTEPVAVVPAVSSRNGEELDLVVSGKDSTEALRNGEEVFTDTIVLLAENGTIVESWNEVSSVAQREEEANRRFVDSRLSPEEPDREVYIGCDRRGALWLYDEYNFTGNRLCLSRENPSQPEFEWIDLSTIPKRSGTWEGAVRSLWTGINPILFYSCGPIGSQPKTVCYIDPEPLWFDEWTRAPRVPSPRRPYNTVNLYTP
jgi:hypothetical protein